MNDWAEKVDAALETKDREIGDRVRPERMSEH